MDAPLCAAVRLYGTGWGRVALVIGVSANACNTVAG